jgi:hypothetical protein
MNKNFNWVDERLQSKRVYLQRAPEIQKLIPTNTQKSFPRYQKILNPKKIFSRNIFSNK